MSETVSPDQLLETRGDHRTFDAFIVAATFDRSGVAAFALGDGTVVRGADWQAIPAHDGAVLAMAAHPAGGFVTGGDDGALMHVRHAATPIANFGGRWVEQVASWGDGKGVVACSAGKFAHVFDAGGAKLKQLEHPSTVTGLAFDGKGKRLGASHVNGVSLWYVAAKEDKPRRLEWKGSHTGIAMHPGGDAIVTAMQESALHGWRLADGQHMRMSGYPSKTASMAFSRNGKWLASSGAESVVLWPFFGGGPMGKAPTELAGGDGVFCSRVACHPQHDAVAAGFQDGLVVLADLNTQRIVPVAAPGRGPVSALAWNLAGTQLAFGTETGFAALVDLSAK